MRNLAASAFLVMATLIVYAQIGFHDYVSYDDGSYVYNNPHVREGISAENLGWAFRSTEQANWHPLTWISHMLDSEIYGVDAPGMHHLTSLMLHLFNALLMFFVLQRMTCSFWPSLFVAAAFALHPQHVESVAWLAERKDVLSQFFWLLCIGSYVEFTRGAGRKWYWIALTLLAMGLMSKPMLVTAPFLFLLLDFWPLDRLQCREYPWTLLRARVVEKIPMFGLVGISALVTFEVQRGAGAVQEYPLWHQAATVVTGYVRYVGKALIPTDLAILYPNHVGMWQTWQIALSLVLLSSISVGVYRLRARSYLVVGWLWFLGTLVPVVGIVSIGALSMADRYTYMPLTGLLIMLAWGGVDLCRARVNWQEPVAALAIVVLGIWAMMSFQQAKTWRDSLSLYAHALSVTQDNPIIHLNYGEQLLKAGRIEESIYHSSEAVRLDSSLTAAYLNLGNALYEKGDVQGALKNYRQAIDVDSSFFFGYLSLGNLLREEGELEQALNQYQRALSIQPDSVALYRNIAIAHLLGDETVLAIDALQKALKLDPTLPGLQLQIGNILYRQGQFEQAVEVLQRAVEQDPSSLEAHRSLGANLVALGRKQEGLESFQQALQLNPDDLESLKNVGVGLVVLDRPAEALVYLARAVQIAPEEAVVYYNLASGLRALDQLDQAMANYRSAIEQDAKYLLAYLNLGRTLREQGQLLEAVRIARIAVQENPDQARAHNSLGISLAITGNMEEAVVSFRRALELDPDFQEAQANLRRAESNAIP